MIASATTTRTTGGASTSSFCSRRKASRFNIISHHSFGKLMSRHHHRHHPRRRLGEGKRNARGVVLSFARRGGGLVKAAAAGDEDLDEEVWEDDYDEMDDEESSTSSTDNLDWRTQMKLDDMANNPPATSSSSSRFSSDADDDDYFMKPASVSAMKDDENAWVSPSNPFMSSDFSSGPDDGWFDNDDWLQPAYTEVTAEPGSILEKVQRLHLGEPADHTFQDGEYFTLTNFVKQKADNDFCLVLEVAERARERKIERLESLHPTPEINALPEIQQAIVDLALEVDASGGKTSAFLAMSEAADRARLRWELQEASWCWDNWVEEHMAQFGISERAAKLLHMGERVEDAMDFEASLYDRDDGGFPGRR